MDAKIKSTFWSDQAVEEASSEVKLVAIYLITHERRNNAGYIEPPSPKRFEFELGIPFDALGRSIEALPHMLLRCGKGVWISTFIKHQIGDGESLARNLKMATSVLNALDADDTGELRKLVLKKYPSLRTVVTKGSPANGIGSHAHPSPSIPFPSSPDSIEGLRSLSKGDRSTRAEQSRAEQSMERGAGRTTEPSLEEARIFIADLFSRKKSDRWSCEEEHLLAEIEPTREQLDTVAAFYRAAADGTDQMLSSRKQKVVTLLRDFSGEVDRARQWRKKNGAPPRSEKKEPAGWRAWRDEKYPGAGGDSFFDLTADVQREFYADQQEAAS